MRFITLTTSALSVLAAACSLHVSANSAAAQVSFRSLGPDYYSRVNALSAYGSVAVGEVNYTFGSMPCAWNTATGELIEVFGSMGRRANASSAYSVTADGSIATGYAEYDPVLTGGGAMRWTVHAPRGNAVALPPGPRGYRGWGDGGRGVTADGSTIVGQSGGQAVLWTSGSVEPLLPSEVEYSRATAITPDGTTAIGFYSQAGSFADLRAFSWSAARGTRELPGVGGETSTSWAAGISADGRAVVGYSGASGDGVHMTRWTVDPTTGAGRPEDLASNTPFMPLTLGAAAISADGSVIGGMAKLSSDPEAGQEAVIWTEDTGLVSLTDLLIRSGVAIPIDPSLGRPIRLQEIASLSADGRTIAGNYFFESGGYDTPVFGFIATIPAPSHSALLVFGAVGCARRRARADG